MTRWCGAPLGDEAGPSSPLTFGVVGLPLRGEPELLGRGALPGADPAPVFRLGGDTPVLSVPGVAIFGNCGRAR